MGIIDAPGLYTWDTSLRKTFRINERFRLRLQGDSTNLMNHANFRNLQTKITNKQYGQVTAAGPPRNLSAMWMVGPEVSAQARSRQFSSSRTLPGQS